MLLSKEQEKERNEKIAINNKAELMRLLAWVGSRQRLANACGVTPQTVYYWINRGRISATCAKIVEQETAGLFKKVDLRADVKDWS